MVKNLTEDTIRTIFIRYDIVFHSLWSWDQGRDYHHLLQLRVSLSMPSPLVLSQSFIKRRAIPSIGQPLSTPAIASYDWAIAVLNQVRPKVPSIERYPNEKWRPPLDCVFVCWCCWLRLSLLNTILWYWRKGIPWHVYQKSKLPLSKSLKS